MTGRATTPEAKKAILARLYRVWMRVGDQRFLQMAVNYLGPMNQWYGLEDSSMVEILEAKIPNPKDSK